MNSSLLNVLGACAATFLFVSAQAETLLATQDTYVNGIKPDDNFGASTLISVRNYGPTNGFIQFDVTNLSGGTIDSATLILSVEVVKSGGTVDIKPVDAAWSENTLTFNTQPSFGTSLGSTVVASGDVGGTVSIDVTSIVQGWAAGTTANYGLALTASSVNVRLGSKEGDVPAKLDVTTSGAPTRTTVNVPQDFDTIQLAIDNISVTWCPTEALSCAISVAPGVFDGFTFILYESPQPQTVAIVGAGENATVIGSVRTFPGVLNANTTPELRNLTVREDGVFLNAIDISQIRLFLIDNVTVNGTISVIGSEDIFSSITLSDVKAQRIEVGDSFSDMDVRGSDIGIATVNEASIKAKYSSFDQLFADPGSGANITFCSVNEMGVSSSNVDIVNSAIRLLSVSGGRVDIGNSIVERVVDEDGTILKCQFVVDENFDAYQSDCTLPAP